MGGIVGCTHAGQPNQDVVPPLETPTDFARVVTTSARVLLTAVPLGSTA